MTSSHLFFWQGWKTREGERGLNVMANAFKKALITGGAGFIGSHIAEELVRQGCTVSVLDNLASGRLENLDAIKTGVNFVQGDIQDDRILAEVVQGCDVVFHQAAVVSVTKTVAEPVQSTAVNDLGTLKVLESARRNGVKRVVLASSSAVYGDDPQLPKIESMATHPLSPYAVQKLTNEHYASLYQRLYGLDAVCLRYFNVYGPRQDPSSPYSGVISIFMTRANTGLAPTIYGNGHQSRDFVFVKDVVQANLLAASIPEAAGQVFNVGTGDSIEINTLWNKIAGLAQCSAQPKYADSRPGDIVHSVAGICKAQEQLGYCPAVSLDQGLAQTLAWYRQTA
jgi:nucleoside-diphosphate-sugar epimerase